MEGPGRPLPVVGSRRSLGPRWFCKVPVLRRPPVERRQKAFADQLGTCLHQTDAFSKKKDPSPTTAHSDDQSTGFTPPFNLVAIGNWENGTWTPWGDVEEEKRPTAVLGPNRAWVVCPKASLKKGSGSITCGQVVKDERRGLVVVLETLVPAKGQAFTAVLVLVPRRVEAVPSKPLLALQCLRGHVWLSKEEFDRDVQEGRVALQEKTSKDGDGPEALPAAGDTKETRASGAAPVVDDERVRLLSNLETHKKKYLREKEVATTAKERLREAEVELEVAKRRVKELEATNMALEIQLATAKGEILAFEKVVKKLERVSPRRSRSRERSPRRKRSKSQSRSRSRSRERRPRRRRSRSPDVCEHCHH